MDLDLLFEKAKNYVEQYRDLIKNGTILIPEFPIDPPKFLMGTNIDCPNKEFRPRGIVNYVEPHCVVKEGKYAGKKVIGIYVMKTLAEPLIQIYLDGDEEYLINKLFDILTSYIVVFNRGFFEAYVSGFLSDENSVVLAGYNDAKAFVIAVRSLVVKDVDYSYINMGKVMAIKLPKEGVREGLNGDTFLIEFIGSGVLAVPVTRDDVYKLIMSEYDSLRAELIEVLHANPGLEKTLREIVEEIKQGS